MHNPLKLGFFLAALGIAPASIASDYSVDWYVISGGGSESQSTDPAGEWSLVGTIGQPATGAASGSEYSLDTGYWSFTTASEYIIFSDSFEEPAP